MKVIEISKISTGRKNAGKPIIRFMEHKIILSQQTYRQIIGDNNNSDQVIYLRFGVDSDQLFCSLHKEEVKESVSLKLTKERHFAAYSKALSAHFRSFTGSNDKNVSCLISIGGVDDDGWFPIITNYWKNK